MHHFGAVAHFRGHSVLVLDQREEVRAKPVAEGVLGPGFDAAGLGQFAHPLAPNVGVGGNGDAPLAGTVNIEPLGQGVVDLDHSPLAGLGLRCLHFDFPLLEVYFRPLQRAQLRTPQAAEGRDGNASDEIRAVLGRLIQQPLSLLWGQEADGLVVHLGPFDAFDRVDRAVALVDRKRVKRRERRELVPPRAG